jgi:hypothetical protein
MNTKPPEHRVAPGRRIVASERSGPFQQPHLKPQNDPENSASVNPNPLQIPCPEKDCELPPGTPCSIVQWVSQGRSQGGYPSCHDSRYHAVGIPTGTGNPHEERESTPPTPQSS